MNSLNTIFNHRLKNLLFGLIAICCLAGGTTGATRTWDGGGATNNFSDAANWTNNTAPTNADDVVFDATATKSVTIDAALTVSNFSINSGYTGTITQTANLTVTNTFTQSAGIFQGTASDANFGVLILNAGSTFNAPSGTLSVNSQSAYYIFDFNGGTFNANGGTFNANGRADTNYFRGLTPTFNNLTISKPVVIFNPSLTVNGTLTLGGGSDLQSAFIQANGNVSFADGANGVTGGSTEIRFSDNATRTATVSGTTINLPILINNPNITVTTNGTSGTVVWNKKVTIQQGVLQQTAANYTFTASAGFNNPGFSVAGGTFQGSTANAIFNTSIGISSGNVNAGAGDFGTSASTCPAFPQQNYYFQQSGGTFTGSAGNAKFCDLRRSGGAFTAPSGNLKILNYGDFAGGNFSANSGTLTIGNNASINAPSLIFNNVTLEGASGHGVSGTPKPQINGTFNMTEGQFSSGDVAVNGDVIYGASFTGGGGRLFFEDSATRTVNLPASDVLLGMVIDNPNIVVTTSGAGASTVIGSNTEVKRGTFRQGNAQLNFGPGAAGGGNAYSLTVAGGTFEGSAAPLSFNNAGGIFVTSGAFQGGAGTLSGAFGWGINQSGGTFSSGGNIDGLGYFTLSGGTFNAPSGVMTVVADYTHTAGGTFNAGTGTVKFTGYNTFNCINQIRINVAANETFYNLQLDNSFCNQRYLIGGGTLVVNNNFRLTTGSLAGGRIRPLGTTTIDASYNGYSSSTVVEYVAPNTNFVINNPATTVSMMPVEINAANSTLTNSGAGRINFGSMNLLNGTVNQGAGIWEIVNPGYSQSGGTFNGSAAELFISNGTGNPVLTGGTFNSGAGKVTGSFRVAGGTMSIAGDLDAIGFSLEGGIFNAPLGTMSIGQTFSHTLGGTFNARTGTVQTSTAAGTYQANFDVNSTETFNNLRFNGTNNNANHGIGAGDTLIVNGTLNFNGRGVNGGSIVANGAVSYTTFGGYQNATTLVRLEGATARTVTFTNDCSSYFQPTLVDNPNIVVNTGCDDANAVLYWQSFDLRQGTVNAGNSRSIFNADFNQSGGTFNAGSNAINPATSFGGNFTLSGGDFNAAPITFFYANYTHTAGGNFSYGTGTVNFVGFGGTYNAMLDVNGAENFNNVIFSPPNGLYSKTIASGDTIVANGNLTITGGGYVNGGTLEAKRDFTISGGFLGGSSNVLFSGAIDQTYTNGNNGSPYGTWTVNKPAASFAEKMAAPAAATSLFLSGNISNPLLNSPSAPLNVASGIVRQTGNFNHALASLNVASETAFVNFFGGTITLAGDVTNNGSIVLDSSGAGCQADNIFLRSSAPGTQRAWNGAGNFRLIDVNVQDQAGGAPIHVYSSTNNGNNGANWTFDAACIAPTAATVTIGGRVVNSNGRGISKAQITLVDASGQTRYATTNPFGFYRFAEVSVGQTLTVTVNHKIERFAAPTRVMSVTEELIGVDFIALAR